MWQPFRELPISGSIGIGQHGDVHVARSVQQGGLQEEGPRHRQRLISRTDDTHGSVGRDRRTERDALEGRVIPHDLGDLRVERVEVVHRDGKLPRDRAGADGE